MPLVRIMVDGYSLLHSWPELARGKARHSSAARTELIHVLRQYGDARGTPVTVVFDGAQPSPQVALDVPSTPEMEIIYSRAGQTADDIIERVTARLVAYGEVLVVSDDIAERDTVRSVGGNCSSCLNFIRMIEATLRDFQSELERYRRREQDGYRKR